MDSRIKEHPILGEYDKGRPVTFTYDGKTLEEDGVMVRRYTAKKQKPRGMFCASGRCTDCVMVVNGEPNVRTCMTPLKEGMNVQTQYGNSAKPFEEQGGAE